MENRTILTPQKGAEGDAGFLAAKVTDATGSRSTTCRSATGPGGTGCTVTTVDGCAVFEFSTAGSYTLTPEPVRLRQLRGIPNRCPDRQPELGNSTSCPSPATAAAANVTRDVARLPAPTDAARSHALQLRSGRRETPTEPDGGAGPVTGLWPFRRAAASGRRPVIRAPLPSTLGYPRPDAVLLDGERQPMPGCAPPGGHQRGG